MFFSCLTSNPKPKPKKKKKKRVVIDSKTKKHFKTIARRLYRIFAFSFYHYREVFDKFENETHLCARFTKFLKLYKLMSSKLFIISKKF